MILKIDLHICAVALDYILLHRVGNLMISAGGQYGNIFMEMVTFWFFNTIQISFQ